MGTIAAVIVGAGAAYELGMYVLLVLLGLAFRDPLPGYPPHDPVPAFGQSGFGGLGGALLVLFALWAFAHTDRSRSRTTAAAPWIILVLAFSVVLFAWWGMLADSPY